MHVSRNSLKPGSLGSMAEGQRAPGTSRQGQARPTSVLPSPRASRLLNGASTPIVFIPATPYGSNRTATDRLLGLRHCFPRLLHLQRASRGCWPWPPNPPPFKTAGSFPSLRRRLLRVSLRAPVRGLSCSPKPRRN